MNMFINFLFAAVVSGTSLLFGTTGEIMCQKAGNLNLGVEGMMWVGAICGFFAAYKTDSLLCALLLAFVSSALCALIYAFLTVTMRANQNVTGLTLTTFGIGIARVFSNAITNSAGGAPALSDKFMSKALGGGIPILSDIPYIGKLLFGHSPFVYIAIAIAIICALHLNRTRRGLDLRAVGENPSAADAAGINVTLVKYINIVCGGGICGLGGVYMSVIIANGTLQPGGIVNGMGWIAVALVIFAAWSPAKAIFGSFIFGAFNIVGNYIPASVITIPQSIYQMLPFLLTTLVLIITSVRQKKTNAQPAACGVNYFREDR